MKHITSRHNPAIKHIIELKTAKKRAEYGQCIVEGVRAVTSFISYGCKPQALYCTQKMEHSITALAPLVEIIILDEHVMSLISSATTPSGILGVFEIPARPSPSALSSGIVLAQIQDPGNMGTIIRTVAALNLTTVVVIEGCDPWSSKVIQASAGTLAAVTVFEWSWQELIEHKQQFTLCALVARGGVPPQQLTLNNSLLVVGNEAHGLPSEWIQLCDQLLTIPMPGNVESLNAAVAASLALYNVYQKN